MRIRGILDGDQDAKTRPRRPNGGFMDPRQAFWSSAVAFKIALEFGLPEEYAITACRKAFGEMIVELECELMVNAHIYN